LNSFKVWQVYIPPGSKQQDATPRNKHVPFTASLCFNRFAMLCEAFILPFYPREHALLPVFIKHAL
jgi:hypothetical protein